jgi:hypothetical protein
VFELLTPVVMKSSSFWDITPCSPFKAEFSTCFMLPFLLAYSSTCKMEATCLSETSVDFQLTVNHYWNRVSWVMERSASAQCAVPEFANRILKVNLSLYRPWRPLGLREVEASIFYRHSAHTWFLPLRTGRFLSPGRFLVLTGAAEKCR